MTNVLEGRDRGELEDLLRAAPDDATALAIFCGKYVEAAGLLRDALAQLARQEQEEREEIERRSYGRGDSAEVYASFEIQALYEHCEERNRSLEALRARLPAADFPKAAALAAEVDALLAENPVSAIRVAALVNGLDPQCLPRRLRPGNVRTS